MPLDATPLIFASLTVGVSGSVTTGGVFLTSSASSDEPQPAKNVSMLNASIDFFEFHLYPFNPIIIF
ncbi:hypothetical protein [Pseudoalteromonas sp. SaAl2]